MDDFFGGIFAFVMICFGFVCWVYGIVWALTATTVAGTAFALAVCIAIPPVGAFIGLLHMIGTL